MFPVGTTSQCELIPHDVTELMDALLFVHLSKIAFWHESAWGVYVLSRKFVLSENKDELRGAILYVGAAEKWRRARDICHHRRGFQNAIMVILVAIWVLHEVRDRPSAITRARLYREKKRRRAISYQLGQPSQAVAMSFLNASLSPSK